MNQTLIKKITGTIFFAMLIYTLTIVSALSQVKQARTPDVNEINSQKKSTVFGMYETYEKDFPKAIAKTPEEVIALLKEKPLVFVDVRKKEERAVSSLPNSITPRAFIKEKNKYKNNTVIAYCTIGYRSGKFAEKQSERDLIVYNLKGGILAWVLEGGEVFNNNQPIKKVHVYGKKWNLLPEGYTPVYF